MHDMKYYTDVELFFIEVLSGEKESVWQINIYCQSM